MHVLIMEDELDLGQALLSSLRHEGISGVCVRNCKDAAAHLQNLEDSASALPDGLLLDVSPPDGNGLELLGAWATSC
jgi:DNA-binding response OmpR family regulator